MRALAGVALVSVLSATVAQAQPGQAPPPPQGYPPPQQPYYPPGPPGPPAPYPYAPPPYGYHPPAVQLTPEEQALLAQGEISDGQHIGGIAAAIMLGFGSGQAVQGRWGDKGWIFTLGEVGSLGLVIVGATRSLENCGFDESCDEDDDGVGMIVTGLIAFCVFRVWETIDAIAAPSSHNRKVQDLRMRAGYPPPMYSKVIPYVSRTSETSSAGLSIRF